MSTGTITPYRSAQRPGRDDFPHLLRAEWTKFRTVRGWVIAVIGAAALAVLAVVALAAAASGGQNPAANPMAPAAIGPGIPTVAIGPGGVFPAPAGETTPRGPQPWAKAGIIIKASNTPGSAYAAVMATPGHGVRMQWNYTSDAAGLPGAASAASPRWLRLTRSGDTITGYDSADGSHWTTIGTATLAGLPQTVQTWLFVASPLYPTAVQQFASNTGTLLPTQATAVFDRVSLAGGRPGATWSAGHVGRAIGMNIKVFSTGEKRALADSLVRSGGTFRVTGYGGDIAPYVTPEDPLVIVPVILAIILPQGSGLWVLRLTPAAAFGVQQGIPQYSQVMNICEPHNDCFPLAPWAGFAVSCAWAAAALGLAVYLLRRRDA